MNFEASRAKALDKLNNFVENNLSEYSKLRNFDYGPDNRSNISCLSPYILLTVLLMKKKLSKNLLINFHLQKMKNLFKKYCGVHIGKVG